MISASQSNGKQQNVWLSGKEKRGFEGKLPGLTVGGTKPRRFPVERRTKTVYVKSLGTGKWNNTIEGCRVEENGKQFVRKITTIRTTNYFVSHYLKYRIHV